MAKSQLHVATIVGSSTDTAWSQTYHAGGVTAVVSVQEKEGQNAASLSLVGKDLLNTFESEYFTLETKNLASIKQAVEITYQKSKDTHDISLIVAVSIQNALYLVLAGKGKIQLMRKETLATLLQQQEDGVLSASGFLETGDILILETRAFAEKIPASQLLDTFSENTVADAAEILSPHIHKEKDGACAALFFSYIEEAPSEALPEIPNEAETPEQAPTQAQQDEEIIESPPLPRKKIQLTHKQKIFLTIALVLGVVLVATAYFSLQKKETSQNTTLFAQLYPPAKSKYDEAQGLQNLNSALAHNDYVQAQQMLIVAKGKFPAGSSEEKQIFSLLDKVNAQLTPSNNASPTAMTKVASGTDAFLDFAGKHTDTPYIAQGDTSFYYADSSGISQVAQSGGSVKQIIQNGGDWKSLGGFGTYLGNMYILDTKDGIDKYAVTSSGFGSKTAYFSGNTPDLSKAVSIAIDGSIWILETDGTLVKYTKGTQDTFTITGLSTSLVSPTQIVTSVDDANIYVLDNGNARLVVIKKDGTFVAQYSNPLLKSATQLDINESAKKAYILSDDAVYELYLK